MRRASFARVTLEELVESLVTTVAEADLASARAEFEEATGAFAPADAFYEERIRAFFEWLVCGWRGGALLVGRVAAGDRQAIALSRANRSLYRVTARDPAGELSLTCLLRDARFAVVAEGAAARLEVGDVLDGRLVGHERRVWLAPGPIFHPQPAHEALTRIVARARAEGRDGEALLDALRRTRMRFDRFTNMSARHVYRYDALERREILAAPWAE